MPGLKYLKFVFYGLFFCGLALGNRLSSEGRGSGRYLHVSLVASSFRVWCGTDWDSQPGPPEILRNAKLMYRDVKMVELHSLLLREPAAPCEYGCLTALCSRSDEDGVFVVVLTYFALLKCLYLRILLLLSPLE